MRVVLDTNIIVSFLLTGGLTISDIFKLWHKRQFALLISEEILLEVKQILTRFINKNFISPNQAQTLIRRLKKNAELITVTSIVTAVKDKSDNRFLACAMDGKADYLVTGDKKHLLPLDKFGQTKIISPKDLVNIITKL